MSLNQNRKKALLLVTLLVATLLVGLVLGIYQTPSPGLGKAKLPSASVEFTSVPAETKAVSVHRYESPKMDPVNLYWLETKEGIILVDTGRFLSQAQYALAEIRAQTDKTILGILLTHPHTDHYGGLPVFVKAAGADVPIYASQITYDDMKTDGQGFIKVRNELHGNDFPDHDEIPLPNRIVKDGDEFQLGGLTFKVIDLPKNETIVTTLYYLPQQGALFAGDIITNKSIPFLGDGYSKNWLTQLQVLQQRYPDQMVYHGHGEPGRARPLIKAQIEYIETLRNLVAKALSTGISITSEEKEAIVAQMEKRYPDYRSSLVLPGLLENGINGIAKELKQESE
jgi:glyoxylase-like metal-dependent hydrolase (beta-lactamase superfamily II)